MAEPQGLVLNLNEIIQEYTTGEEEVHLKPQTKTTLVAEQEVQKKAQNQAQKGKRQKRAEQSRTEQAKEVEDDEAFILDETYSFWEKNMSNKGFIGERGFSKFISLFAEIIEKRGWSFFCKHKPPGFAAVVKDFYSNMIDMRDDSVYVRGVWVPIGHERINKVLQIKDPKNGSKFRRLLSEPNHDKIVDFLTAGKGKWSSAKKNPHESINRGSLTKEAKVWFYFIASVIIPTKHLSTIMENEAILLYALLKGYKFDVGKIIESSIRSFHKIVKRGLIPYPATITRLCILAGVKGIWVEEQTYPKVSSLTLIGVIKGPKGRKRKEMEIVEVAEELQEEEEEQVGMEQFPEESQLPVEEEMHNRRSPLILSPPDVRETFSKPTEWSRNNQGNTEIMEMMVSMKKEMEEREKRWEQQQRIREEFLEADFRRRE